MVLYDFVLFFKIIGCFHPCTVVALSRGGFLRALWTGAPVAVQTTRISYESLGLQSEPVQYDNELPDHVVLDVLRTTSGMLVLTFVVQACLFLCSLPQKRKSLGYARLYSALFQFAWACVV